MIKKFLAYLSGIETKELVYLNKLINLVFSLPIRN